LVARRADALGKHLCYRTAAGPDVEAPPALLDADRVELPPAERIVAFLKQRQT
jgi:hypothetical protein